ncbi:MAG: hypothetical protein LBP72_00130 [Dysgonamonadaceae bacterium]|jgi:uncharacterized protein (TIGR02145 family)|nr:hypothetical protein [Dysgonamonadaceae bacterium]
MRTKILVLSLALALSANLRAQVSIGDLTAPAKGALLDLNKAVKGGLALSNVELANLYTIPATFPDITSPVSDPVKQDFTGAMVYHTGENGIAAGIYVWNGTNWTPATENCQPLTSAQLNITPSPTILLATGGTAPFSVSIDASERCTGGETYSWSVTPSTNTVIQKPSETNTPITFNAEGMYNVKVTVANHRYTDPASPVESGKTTVYVTADGTPATLTDANYGITGDFCYDVKGPNNSGQSSTFYASRTDAFESGFTKTYTFTYTNTFSNLTVLNPGGIVASVSKPAKITDTGSGAVTFTITFVSDVEQQVIDNNGPIQVQLLVGYDNHEGKAKIAYKNIKVQDGDCGCPVQTSATKWLTFQCHNLGADYGIRSDAELALIDNNNFREYHGDWYRWGSKTASLVNTGTSSDGIPGWNSTTPDYQESSEDDGSLWKAANNPCPDGWRLPMREEWRDVFNHNSSNIKRYVGGTESNNWSNGNVNSVLKIGDCLYLPAAGSRHYNRGDLQSRGTECTYWSSSITNSSSAHYLLVTKENIYPVTWTDRLYGFSVRCVADE